ncbi:MAG: hypothetical protein KJ831_03075, partial [Candidatus Eisenbacteria bacterium]|nr:hypothetical protein [Candidatus Eisenbacteria bacterium]
HREYSNSLDELLPYLNSTLKSLFDEKYANRKITSTGETFVVTLETGGVIYHIDQTGRTW